MPVKRASNDLRRLWRMGFLRRTSVKRSCLTRGGRLCNKGFEYRYYLSSQGMKYLEWLQGRKMTEDFAYEKLISEVLSHLPEELKDRLSTLNLAKATRRYKGPSRKNTNFLESNIVPVTHLSTQNMRLRSEKETLEKANTIQQVKLVNLQQTINNYEEQNKSLNTALAQALLWAASNKNSAEAWEGRFAKAFWRLGKVSPHDALSIFAWDAGDDANTLKPTNGADAPLFDPRTDISHIPGVMGRAGIGAPISLIISWREHYGKTFTVREETPQGPGRIVATWKITPEIVRNFFEKQRASAQEDGPTSTIVAILSAARINDIPDS
jgi:hypothetical protein